MSGRLIILGASGHGRVVADVARLNGYSDIVFLDSNPSLTTCAGYPVLGSVTMTDELDGDVFVAIGNPEVRKKLMNRYKTRKFPVLIHPSAVVARDVKRSGIGAGSVIMANAVINTGTKLGCGVIVNTSSSIDHDCKIGDFVHVAIGAHLAGTVVVGDKTWIGAGVTVSNNINICEGCMIGAGAVVVKDITDSGVYIGVPAIRYTKECSKNNTPPPPKCQS